MELIWVLEGVEPEYRFCKSLNHWIYLRRSSHIVSVSWRCYIM